MHLHNQREWHSQPRGPASQLHSLHLGTQQIGSLQRAPFNMNMNEIIGECRQSYNARNNKSDLRWSKWKFLLEKVSSQREEYKQIIDALLPGWDNKFE